MPFKIFLVLFLFTVSSFTQEKPKNIIILIGDGMGANVVSSSVLSLKNSPFRKFTTTGFSITKSANKFITDSGAGATALSTGTRTNNGWIAIAPDNTILETIFEKAEKLGYSTGAVATSSITNATPAAFLSHVDNRKNENDIAYQIAHGSADVLIGGGANFFLPESEGGLRKDSLNLFNLMKEKGFTVLNSFESLKEFKTDKKFISILDKDGLKPAGTRNYNLGELSKKAIELLSKDKDGFVLMIEGSQIDWYLHNNDTKQTLNEQSDFNEAINAALDFAAKDKNTLVIVTADHETGGMSISGGELDGSNIEMSYTTKGHTAEMVGVFAKGPGEKLFSGINENYEIGKKLVSLLKKKK